MTDPMTPPDMDLRGLSWMPLDVRRLLDSDLFALATGDEFKAAVALWCKSWSQIPAASLPNDDRILASLSGSGEQWPVVRATALRGWQVCSDGRLYHAVVAEQAHIAAAWRDAHRQSAANAAARKQREREERATLFESIRATGTSLAWNTPTTELREIAAKIAPRHTPVTVTGHAPDTVTVTAKTGQDRTGHAKEEALGGGVTPPTQGHEPARAAAAVEIWQVLESSGVPVGILGRTRHAGRIGRWVDQGVTVEQLEAAIERARAARVDSGDSSPINPGFVECHLLDVLAGQHGGSRKRGFKHGDDIGRRFAAGEG